nr:MAG TPA: hypothetical protein [Bacteriophage sp.]
MKVINNSDDITKNGIVLVYKDRNTCIGYIYTQDKDWFFCNGLDDSNTIMMRDTLENLMDAIDDVVDNICIYKWIEFK